MKITAPYSQSINWLLVAFAFIEMKFGYSDRAMSEPCGQSKSKIPKLYIKLLHLYINIVSSLVYIPYLDSDLFTNEGWGLSKLLLTSCKTVSLIVYMACTS